MKTLKTLISSILFASVTMAGMVYAAPMSENELYDIIHPESADIFNAGDYQRSGTPEIVSLGDDHNKNSVWSVEFEQYINPNDLQKTEISSIDDVNQYMGNKPTASGSGQQGVFIYNETAGEYHLQ